MVSHGRVVWLRAGGELGAAYRAVPYTDSGFAAAPLGEMVSDQRRGDSGWV